MKVITQILPNEHEIVFNNLKIENYILDQDTYSYFLNLFENEFGDYVFKKTGIKKMEPLTIDDQRNISPNDALKKLREQNAWQDIAKKYFKKFNKERPKFYLYKGGIYSYIFLGWLNVGHVVEVLAYDNEDLIQLLNFRERKKIFW